MRFLLVLAVAVAVVYAALALSLYGSLDPCEVLRVEIVRGSIREAERQAIERGEPGLAPRDRRDLERRSGQQVASRIAAAELTPVRCLRLYATLKTRGPEAEEVRPFLPSRPGSPAPR